MSSYIVLINNSCGLDPISSRGLSLSRLEGPWGPFSRVGVVGTVTGLWAD
jgi:hypothetical protein